MVTRPAVPPYSSTTIALCTCLTCSSRRSSATRLPSGTTCAGRSNCGTTRDVPCTPSRVTRSLANTNPRMSSRLSSYTGMREYSSSAKSARNSATVASCAMATISGRGVMTSRTSVPPKSTTDCSSLRSSVSSATASGSAVAPGGPAESAAAPPLDRASDRVRGGRANRSNPPVTGPRIRSARSNDGNSRSSVRPASRRTSADGTSCSHTTTNRTIASSNPPLACGVATPIIRASTTAADANSRPRSSRVTTYRRSGSSRYVVRDSCRASRSAVSRAGSRTIAPNADSMEAT